MKSEGVAGLEAPWRIGIDVGGTFTDLVLTDSAAVSRVVKVPSIPADPSQGVLAALERLAGDLDCAVEDVLGDCALFLHGSTVATNRMIEGKGARVGLLTTEGFRDALEIRRGLQGGPVEPSQALCPGAGSSLSAHGRRGRIDTRRQRARAARARGYRCRAGRLRAPRAWRRWPSPSSTASSNDRHEAEAAAHGAAAPERCVGHDARPRSRR